MLIKIVLPVLVFALLTLTTCKKKEDPRPFWGTASARFNGESWNEMRGWQLQVIGSMGANADLPPCQPGIVHVLMEKSTAEGAARERLYISKIPPAVGTYPVRIYRTCEEDTFVGGDYVLLGADGDVLLDTYRVLEAEDNWVQITSFNPNTGEIRGAFQIAFVYGSIYDTVKREKVVTSFPDTIRFTNGQFHTRISRK